MVYPTLIKTNKERKSGLKDRTNILNNQSKSINKSENNDDKSLKVWSVTTKSVQVFSNKFENIEKNNSNIKKSAGSYLFEIIGIFNKNKKILNFF